MKQASPQQSEPEKKSVAEKATLKPQSATQTKAQSSSLPAIDPPPVAQQSPASINLTGLPVQLKNSIESLSGFSLNDVNVHYNSSLPAQLHAHAYTQGSSIFVGPGQEKHLAHEAWHVVQQKQGRVSPTIHFNGTPINDNPGLEAEATSMGNKAAQTAAQKNYTNPLQLKSVTAQRVVQRATALQFNAANIPAAANIVGINHQRRAGGVPDPEANAAFAAGEFNALGAGAVCNHARPYNTIQAQLTAQLAGQTVQAAATQILNLAGVFALPGGHPGNNLAVLQRAQGGLDNPPQSLNGAFDYYYAKIGNYAQNLFYWPATTGGNPDLPQNVYTTAVPPVAPSIALPGGWGFRNAGKADAQKLIDETARVNGGVANLTGAGL